MTETTAQTPVEQDETIIIVFEYTVHHKTIRSLKLKLVWKFLSGICNKACYSVRLHDNHTNYRSCMLRDKVYRIKGFEVTRF